MSNPLFTKKSIASLISEADDSEKGLKRTLSAGNLVALGIGAIIGAGLFVRTADAAANHAGPAVTLSFIIAAIGCALAGLCYAEFASMIPIAGSAYTYSYATMGEFTAWIIGWDLVLEYALGAATVSIAWSQYLNIILGYFGLNIPYEFCHSPFETSLSGISGIINLPAVFIVLLLTIVLIRGIKESAKLNSIIVIVKVAIVLLFIALGWSYINPANHTPYIPENTSGVFGEFGWSGILSGASIVFFAFIGFDAVSTAAQEAKNPKKDMPIGILVSLLICTVLYILFGHVFTGIANYTEFRLVGKEASVAYAIREHLPYKWLELLVSIAIIAGFSSVILVMLMGQSRVFYSMSRDGLVPKVFSELHPKYKTPYKANALFFIFVSLFSAFIPESVVGNMTVIGTLFAFVLVCLAVLVMRKTNPEIPRSFKTPFVPVVPILGILVCLALIFGQGPANWIRLGVWLVIGLVIYFGYSAKNSKVNNPNKK
jgi:basic amino acid/polyamine antiporter, APA family